MPIYLNFAQINGDSIQKRLNPLLKVRGKGIAFIEGQGNDVSLFIKVNKAWNREHIPICDRDEKFHSGQICSAGLLKRC